MHRLGQGFASSTGFKLPNGATRSPDVAWFKRDRWESLTPEQQRKFVPLCPDLVIELRPLRYLRSSAISDELTDLQAKM